MQRNNGEIGFPVDSLKVSREYLQVFYEDIMIALEYETFRNFH